ncbi:MAG: CotH kinase family protein [Saprospiraceae bacterium]|nr:CotH kinase family protein [Candidatus Brachybacter algidus]
MTRAYDLKTNEDADDYSDLVELISFVNKPNAVGFSTNIHNILNIRSVLKTYAVDIATGNWDDYFYLKNNFYLYKRAIYRAVSLCSLRYRQYLRHRLVGYRLVGTRCAEMVSSE